MLMFVITGINFDFKFDYLYNTLASSVHTFHIYQENLGRDRDRHPVKIFKYYIIIFK